MLNGHYKVLLGVGPKMLIINFLTFVPLFLLHLKYQELERIFENAILQNILVLILGAVSIVAIFFSIRSLPLYKRGKILVTDGIFKYVRHPLYASFLLFFTFTEAVYFNSWFIFIWAILSLCIGKFLIKEEEMFLVEVFGKKYSEYQKTTGAFIPKIF